MSREEFSLDGLAQRRDQMAGAGLLREARGRGSGGRKDPEFAARARTARFCIGIKHAAQAKKHLRDLITGLRLESAAVGKVRKDVPSDQPGKPLHSHPCNCGRLAYQGALAQLVQVTLAGVLET